MSATRSEAYVRVGRKCDHRVDFLNPKRHQIFTEDIALGLAKSCRFQGAIRGWYSTAEHCVIGTRLAKDAKLAKEFAIHDASEYVFSDVSGPIKAMLPDYKKMEGDFQRFINEMYLGYPELSPETKELDKRLCATEQYVMRAAPIPDLDGYMPYNGVKFKRWSYEVAFEEYRDLLIALFPGVGSA
jgi:uncharacterized protein